MKSILTIGEAWWLLFATLLDFMVHDYTWQGALRGLTLGIGLMLLKRFATGSS